MIGILIVTHGNLGKEFVSAAEHVLGKQEKIESIALFPKDDMDKKREDIKSAISKLNSGKGVVLLTDLFGGTPSNLAISVMEPDKTEVIAGLNLPMLIKLCSVRNSKDLKEAVEEAKTAGQKYISIASFLL